MKFIFILLLPLFIWAAPDATMRISKDMDQRASIAIIDSSEAGTISAKLHKVFVSDLKISGNFVPDPKSHLSSTKLRAKDYLLEYIFTPTGSGATLDITLTSSASSKLISKKRYSIPSLKKYPFVVHKAVTDINDALGYKPIEWINRYVVFTRYTGKKMSEIVLADYTFAYTKTIIRGGLNLFPKWADEAQKGFYYTSYETGTPAVYHLDIYSGKRNKIVSSEGMLICSDVSKDGSKLLLTMAPDAQPDIYEYDLASKRAAKLTFFSGIDVNGKYAGDGKSIIFVSNRLGKPSIYKTKKGSSAVSQLIFHGKKNSNCDTNGKKIVYSSKEAPNKFNIYLANEWGGSVRPLTSTGVNQFPRFAPNGDTILYIKRSRGVNSIGYIGLKTNQTMLFPLGNKKIQSIDW